jgi:hypothetical protein
MVSGVKILRLAYLVGAIVDFLVFLLMVFPPLASFFWGFREFSNQYFFAMGIGGSLMFGWTLLLLWAYRKPIERRFVAILTIIVIIGVAITNAVMVVQKEFTITELIPTAIIQAILLFLFSYGYYKTHNNNVSARVTTLSVHATPDLITGLISRIIAKLFFQDLAIYL